MIFSRMADRASDIVLEEVRIHEAAYRPPQMQEAVNFQQKLMKYLSSIRTRPDAFRIDLQGVFYERQLAPNLPHGPVSSTHVYVVTSPHIPMEVSRHHWSVYH